MKISNTKTSTFTTFDRTITISTRHQKPDRKRILYEKIITGQIPRGAGLSYTPASFGKNVLVREMSSFNRILEYDKKQKTVVVESGISLKKLLEWSFKEKLFLPVLPGHPEITIGGCIAANVHGKNPRKDGSFKDHLIEMEIFHPVNGLTKIEKNSEIFEATCGGLGLTGIITTAKIQLSDLPSDKIVINPHKTNSLIESINIIEKNTDADVIYAWHNGSTFKNFGHGIVTIGKFGEKFEKNELTAFKKTSVKKIQIPFSFWGKISSSIIFSVFQKMELTHKSKEKNVFDVFFPLTGITQWFHILYGKKGFREYQMLILKENVKEFVQDLGDLIQKEKPNINIISIKPFSGEQKFLQFCGEGYSIVLECPNSDETIAFFKKMDDLVITHKGIPNIIKDSRLTKSVIEKCYPQYDEFIKILMKIDPNRIFKSQCSQQSGL
jgi:decaprenylphospho-beta-D-ribofuranose 2-oxidase